MALRLIASRPVAAVIALIAGLGLLAIGVGPAGAESPLDVAEEVAEDGVYVAFGRGSVDETALIAAVDDARFDGLRIVVVLPNDPQPTASAFARRIQEATEADVALVFPEDGPLESHVIDDLSGGRIRATERARALSDPARAVQAFAEELTVEREAGTPEIVGRIINWVILLALVVGLIVAVEQAIERIKRNRAEARV